MPIIKRITHQIHNSYIIRSDILFIIYIATFKAHILSLTEQCRTKTFYLPLFFSIQRNSFAN